LSRNFYHAKEKRNLGSSTISKIIAIIKSFLNYLEEEDIIIKNQNPVKFLPI